MKTINLKLYLMMLIILIGNACLLSTAIFVLYQSHAKSVHETTISAESIDKQLEVKLVMGHAKGFQSSELFLNFDFWANSENNSGLCVHFEQPDGKIVKRACRGASIIEPYPSLFEKIYCWGFQPGKEVKRPVMQHNKIYGFVTVVPNVETEISHAWHDVKTLIKLSAITITSLCTLFYFAVGWALRPAGLIVAGLEKMAKGNLSTRLADFRVSEWQRTGQAINQLTENLENTLVDRNRLALKLVSKQEDDRRYLTQELHDEFGQSLAGLAAVASSITQTAEKKYPQILSESQSIERITTHMMDLLKDMLGRLRPIDFDELGLIESLQGMVNEWNTRSAGKAQYSLKVVDVFDDLPNTLSVSIFRIVQEAMTNIYKHSNAKHAVIKLEKLKYETGSNNAVSLIILDDGEVKKVEFPQSGMGLQGMRERVLALGGKLILRVNQPSGLIIDVWLPLHTDKEIET